MEELPSILNLLSLQELEMIPESYPYSTRERKDKELPRYITRPKSSYIVRRKIGYDRHYIGSFYLLQDAIKALKQFNLTHNLKD